MSFEISRTRHRHRALGLLWLLLVSSAGWAMDIAPPDTSSPRATFTSFLDLSEHIAERYAAFQGRPSRATQRAFTRAIGSGQYLMDLSGVAPTARRDVAAHAFTQILEQPFALLYETTDDQLRYPLAKLRELLQGHPKTIHTAGDPIRVRFLGFRDHQLTVEMRAYVRTNIYTEFLAIQEDIMLRVIKLVKQAGTGFDLPAQTHYMTRYGGLDDAARMTAEKRVREWASAQELPFPEFTEEQRRQMSDELDYHPEGSPDADRG